VRILCIERRGGQENFPDICRKKGGKAIIGHPSGRGSKKRKKKGKEKSPPSECCPFYLRRKGVSHNPPKNRDQDLRTDATPSAKGRRNSLLDRRSKFCPASMKRKKGKMNKENLIKTHLVQMDGDRTNRYVEGKKGRREKGTGNLRDRSLSLSRLKGRKTLEGKPRPLVKRRRQHHIMIIQYIGKGREVSLRLARRWESVRGPLYKDKG